jgi:microcystin-dependent protein
MAQPFISQILMFGGNFAPKNYALCNGQTMAINQNQALFSLLGTTYGGNGTTNFQLPNLQSSLPMSFGQGPGLSNYNLGQTGGSPSITLQQNDVPAHIHSFMASTSAQATTSQSIGNPLVPGTPSGTTKPPYYLYANPPQPGQPALIPHPMVAGACSTSGASQAHSNLMPSLCITFAICLFGVFPSRN